MLLNDCTWTSLISNQNVNRNVASIFLFISQWSFMKIPWYYSGWMGEKCNRMVIYEFTCKSIMVHWSNTTDSLGSTSTNLLMTLNEIRIMLNSRTHYKISQEFQYPLLWCKGKHWPLLHTINTILYTHLTVYNHFWPTHSSTMINHESV